MGHTEFTKDIMKGKVSERIFVNEFFGFFYTQFADLRDDVQARIDDIDFKTLYGATYDVKTTRYDDRIIIEDATNLEPFRPGWFYKSKAQILAFVNIKTRLIIFLRFDDGFKVWYEENKWRFDLIKNRPTTHNGATWQSAFRYVPVFELKGFISAYKMNQNDPCREFFSIPPDSLE